MLAAAQEVHLVTTDVDLQLLLDVEDVHLGWMDSVENEGEEEREKEGDPASGQEVEDGGEGYSLTIDCQHSTSTSHHRQYGQPDQSDLEIFVKTLS